MVPGLIQFFLMYLRGTYIHSCIHVFSKFSLPTFTISASKCKQTKVHGIYICTTCYKTTLYHLILVHTYIVSY